jgi:predicted acyltransferase
MKKRALSIDALRGFAIITMILSGQMVLTHLPNWMAHAQVPQHHFDPSIYGITWVDLVFPFFLFSMGAAFPFSLGARIEKGESKWLLCWNALQRAAQLVFFAIFFQHMKPFVISDTMDVQACLLSLFAFGLLFLLFLKEGLPFLKKYRFSSKIITLIRVSAFVIGWLVMYNLTYTGKENPLFDIAFSDIIIIVLANMAFFASIIYVFTYKNPWGRLLVLPFVWAIFHASTNEGWVKTLYEFTPIPWAYSFYYLKYLFIVLPGSLAGEYIKEWIDEKQATASPLVSTQGYSIALLSVLLIICNLTFLYSRELVLNLGITSSILIVLYKLLQKSTIGFALLWKKLFIAGAYCLLLGLFFEAYQGGIRKDDSTYSYYFVTSGLAFFGVLFFAIVCDYYHYSKATRFLVLSGQNPMIAYVANALVVMPLLTLLTLTDYFEVFNQGPFMGVLKGVLLTALSVGITVFFSNIKWFWRT